MDDEEREQLHASIERGLDQMSSGQGRPAAEVLADLRSRRSRVPIAMSVRIVIQP